MNDLPREAALELAQKCISQEVSSDRLAQEALADHIQAAYRAGAQSQLAAAAAMADKIVHICEFAANGTVEKMSEDGRSETWKIIAQNSVEQYYSIIRAIRAIPLPPDTRGEDAHGR